MKMKKNTLNSFVPLLNADLTRNKFKERAESRKELLKQLELIRCSQDNITEK